MRGFLLWLIGVAIVVVAFLMSVGLGVVALVFFLAAVLFAFNARSKRRIANANAQRKV